MEKKIFFIDFDGTLMRDDKRFQDKIGKHYGMQWIRTLYRPCNRTSCQQRSVELQKNLN